MTITTHPDDPIGAVRLLIGDNVEDQGALPDERNFSDEEIRYFLDSNDSDVNGAAVMALSTLARHWSRVADTTVGPLKQSFSDISKAYVQQASVLSVQSGSGGATSFMVQFERDDGYAIAAEDESE